MLSSFACLFHATLAKSRWRSAIGQPAGWTRRTVGSTRNGLGTVQVPEDFGYHILLGSFAGERGDGGWNERFWAVRLPFWFLVLLTATPPALAAWLRRLQREDALAAAGETRSDEDSPEP